MDSDDDHDWDGLEIGHDALLTYMQNILRRNTLSDSHIRMAKAPRDEARGPRHLMSSHDARVFEIDLLLKSSEITVFNIREKPPE